MSDKKSPARVAGRRQVPYAILADPKPSPFAVSYMRRAYRDGWVAGFDAGINWLRDRLQELAEASDEGAEEP